MEERGKYATSQAWPPIAHPSAEKVVKKESPSVKKVQEKLQTMKKQILFDADSHTYQLKSDGRLFSSVSETLSGYAPEFDKLSTSKHVARREGLDWEDVLESWRVKRDFAAVKGTEFHLKVKQYLQTGKKIFLSLPTVTPIKRQLQAFEVFWKRNSKRYEVVALECVVFDEKAMVAGTIDMVARHLRTGNYFIFDWKTSEQIRLKSNFHETLQDPFSHIENCELHRYSLQLSLYNRLLYCAIGLEIEQSYFVQFCPDGKYKVFQINDFVSEAQAMLQIKEKNDLKNRLN